LFALLLARRAYVRTEYTMEGLLTHIATADCFITPPHPALDCGIVTAWWHYQVKGTRAHRSSTRTSNASGNLRDDDSVQGRRHGGLEHESDPGD